MAHESVVMMQIVHCWLFVLVHVLMNAHLFLAVSHFFIVQRTTHSMFVYAHNAQQ